ANACPSTRNTLFSQMPAFDAMRKSLQTSPAAAFPKCPPWRRGRAAAPAAAQRCPISSALAICRLSCRQLDLVECTSQLGNQGNRETQARNRGAFLAHLVTVRSQRQDLCLQVEVSYAQTGTQRLEPVEEDDGGRIRHGTPRVRFPRSLTGSTFRLLTNHAPEK